MITPEDKQVLDALKAPFDASKEKKRKGPYDKKSRSHKYFTYIPVHYIQERLDEALGFSWDWQIVDVKETVFRTQDKGTWDSQTRSYVGGGGVKEIPAVSITGRLTITLPSGQRVSRDGTGGADLDKGIGAGDGHKIAASNALKKAAYMFGVGTYLALDGDDAMDDTTMMGSVNVPAYSIPQQAQHPQPTISQPQNQQVTVGQPSLLPAGIIKQ